MSGKYITSNYITLNYITLQQWDKHYISHQSVLCPINSEQFCCCKTETFPGILVKKNQSWWTFLQSPNNSIGHFQTLHRMPGSSGGMSLAASEKSEQTRKVSSLCFQCIDLFMKSLYRCCVMSPRQFGGLRSATKQQTRLKGSSPWSSWPWGEFAL